jgi:sarcosine oxidase subunit gamma
MAELAREVGGVALRRPALDEPRRERQGVSIRVLPGEARFSLRLPLGAVDGAGEIGGFQLGMPINRYSTRERRWSARLGPNEWLIGGPEADASAIECSVEAALVGQIHALTEISHRNVAVEVAGSEAAAVLNAGCALDLSPKAFPAESATRTLFGKAEIVLMKPTSEPAFRVECWRSFARYVHDFLLEAARDCPALPDPGEHAR